MTTRVPSIPNLTDDNVQQVLSAAKEIIEVREGVRGDPLDKAVTFRDLEALNLVEQTALADTKITNLPVQVLPAVNPKVFGPDDYDESADLSTPPAPTNLEATGGYAAIYLSWEYPPYRNHAYAEIYRSFSNDLTTAQLIGSTPGNLYTDPVGTEITAYYWVRNVSQGNVKSPYNSTGGTMAATAVDVARKIAEIESEVLNGELSQSLGSRISQIEISQTLTAGELSVLNAAKDALNAEIIKNGSGIVDLRVVTKDQATSITSLGTRVGTAESNITNLQSTTSTQATSIQTLNSTVSGQTTSIQTLQTTTNGLSGQYTVKIDNNGHVSGFGLASTTVNGTPTSAFIVRADKFAIVDPASTDNNLTNNPSADAVPFAVVGGQTFIKAAFIQDATITNAKIASVAADKITAGTITAAVDMRSPLIRSGAVSYGQAGFFLGNDSGTNKFYIGNGSTGISGRELSFNGTDVTVRGTIFAYGGNISNITASNLTILDNAGNTLLASGSGVRASDLLNSFVTLSGLGAGAFATLSTLTPGNITTYIQSGAIGSALIADAAIVNAKIGNAEITSAKIQDAAITTAKIGTAQVGTLTVAGNAITIPSTVSVTNTSDFIPNGSYQTFISTSISMDVSGVVYASLTASLGFPANPSNSGHELLINNTVVAKLGTGAAFVQAVALSGGLFVNAGTVTVQYRAISQPDGGQSGQVFVNDRTLFVQGAKR